MHWVLLKYRKQLNLTQNDLAKLLRISSNSYGKKENGVLEFKEKEMVTILKTLKNKRINTNLDELFLMQSKEKY